MPNLPEKARLPRSEYLALAPLAKIDPKHVINRYLAGESTTEIAQSLGVTRTGLNFWLLKHAEADWKESQIIKAIGRKESAEDEMDGAQDTLSLSRARERLKAAQWDLERICRRIYGQDQASEASGKVSININLGQSSATIETYPQENSQVIDSE